MKGSMIRSECGRILRAAGSFDRSISCVLSTGIVARDGHVINPRGWILPNSGAVPLIDSHNDQKGIRSVIGSTNTIRVGTADLETGGSGAALLGTLNFAAADINPDAEVAYQLYRAGYADSVSVSFIPVEWQMASDRGRGAMNIDSAELLEVSVVAVPSDVNAKTLARAVRASVAGRATADDRRVLRLAQARALQGPAREADEQFYERYCLLREHYGFTIEQAAWNLGVASSHALRLRIARILRDRSPL